MSNGRNAGLWTLGQRSAFQPRRLPLSLPRLDAANLMVGLLYVTLFGLGMVQFTDPDYGWHVRTGQLIVESHAIPTHDPFTITSGGHTWVTHEWLAEVVMYLVQSAGGYVANVVLFTALAIAALAIAHRTALKLGASRWLTIGVVGLAALMSFPYWTVRPQVFTWLLFAVFLSILVDHRRDGGRQIWLLVPLMLVWANLHLGHMIGLGMVGLYVVTTAAESRLFRVDRELRAPLLVLGACAIAGFANPNTLDQVLYPLQYLRPGNANVELITEWQSPNFHAPRHLVLALGILALLGIGVFSIRNDLFLPALALGFTYFSLQSIRHQPLFALVFVVVMGACITSRPAWLKLDALIGRGEAVRSGLNWSLLIAAGLVVALVVARVPGAQLHATPRLNAGVYYPEAGAAYIETHYPEARVFNTLIWGGYLIDALYPQQVFVDGRSDLHGGDVYNQYLTVINAQPGWQAVLDQYGVDLAIIESDTSIAAALAQSEDWQLAFQGPAESVFVRGAPAVP